MKYLKKLKNELDKLNIYYVGATDSEIETMSNKLVVTNKLPSCYYEFLLNFGKDMDRKEGFDRGFLVGNDVFIDDLEANNGEDGLKGLLEDDDSSLQLPENAFVFYGHQGYVYTFFKLDEGDNPPVYGYIEGYEGEQFPKLSDSLSQFYEDYLEGKDVFNILN